MSRAGGTGRAEHPFDGVRPRSACCPACGYVFGGIEIVESRVRCPECGEAFVFAFPERERARPIPRATRWRWYAALGLAAAVMTGWGIGSWSGLGVALLGWAVAAGVMALLAGVWNRMLAD